MRNTIFTFALLLVMSPLSAGTFENVEAQKYTESLDSEFFQNCLNDLRPYGEGNFQECLVFQAPAGTRISEDGGLRGSIEYIVEWSQYRCKLSDQAKGRLYMSQNSTQIHLIMHDSSCLKEMSRAIQALNTDNFNDKSIYVVKED